MARMYSPASRALVAASVAVLACVGCSSSTSKADGCAPTSSIVASGTVVIDRGTAAAPNVTKYTLSTVQVADLFNEGSLTVTAGNAEGGPGSLDPKAPIALVKMDPSTDEPGTYGLDAVNAQIAYCPTVDETIEVANGELKGCAPSGTPVTMAPKGTLTVMSSMDKSIATATPPSGPSPFSLTAQYGTQAQACN